MEFSGIFVPLVVSKQQGIFEYNWGNLSDICLFYKHLQLIIQNYTRNGDIRLFFSKICFTNCVSHVIMIVHSTIAERQKGRFEPMKSTGIVRRLDELGRITLPIELRRTMGATERDPLEIYVDENKIILQKYEPSDIFTGEKEDLYDFYDKKVSKKSIIELAKMAGVIE